MIVLIMMKTALKIAMKNWVCLCCHIYTRGRKQKCISHEIKLLRMAHKLLKFSPVKVSRYVYMYIYIRVLNSS